MEEWVKTELKVDKPNSLWVVQMAITLRRLGFYKEAIEKSRIAHDLDPDNWRADFCLAQTYALQKDYTTAVQTLSALVSAFRTNQDRLKEFRDVFYTELLDFLGEWNAEISQYDAAMEAFREILENYPDNYETALKVITMLKRQEKFSEIIRFLQDMNKTMNDQGLSRLIAMYHVYADDSTYHDTISFAAQRSNSLGALKEAYQDAVEAAKEDASKLAVLIALRYWYGLTLFHDHHSQKDHDEAVSFWEQNIAVGDSRGSSWDIRYTRSVTAAKLASVYLQRAKDAGLKSFTAQEYLKRLTFLSSGKLDGINVDTPLLLGRLYHLMGQDQQAKECMRGHVRVALDLLSDDDPSNDWQGYLKLAVTLAPFDDDVNALAAWSLIGPLEDEEVEEKLESDPGIANGKLKYGIGQAVDGGTDGGDIDDVDQITQQDLKTADLIHTTSRNPIEEVKVGIETGVAVADNVNDQKNATTSSVALAKEVMASTFLSATTDKVPTNGGAPAGSSFPPQPEAALTSPAPKAKQGNLSNYCDGYCGHVWTFSDDIYACKDCVDIQFEPGCLEKLRNGTLERKVCGRGHEFLHVPKWDDDEHAKIPEGQVKVGGELVAVKDWLNTIRREWGFETVQ